MIKLYSFEELHKYLDNKGYPKVNSDGVLVIKTDFRKAYEEGKIIFENDGIYLVHEGKKWKGYMYMKDYIVSQYGYPRFHLVMCKIIKDFIDKNLFNQYYIWSNAETVDVIDRHTKELYENCNLSLCKNCRDILINYSPSTKDFYDSIKKEIINDKREIQVDIYGYTLDWRQVAKLYKEEKEYTCEHCGIKAKSKADYRFFHVHHKNGNKTNNSENNLECLCIRCHSKIDNHHLSKIDELEIKEVNQIYSSSNIYS